MRKWLTPSTFLVSTFGFRGLMAALTVGLQDRPDLLVETNRLVWSGFSACCQRGRGIQAAGCQQDHYEQEQRVIMATGLLYQKILLWEEP
jgi:hypothetical protein